ncbi:hypothetical protein PS943_04281 [Pseudomonas fluorescens]|uniref:DUF2971 domain-containing protein n=1 Tax=Pseudomonas fluorescens TaxID=294 RepID=A0A5E7WKL7_PSEFL|nr:hypothetical protein [Pseudomonas fluorescens]VVQ35391.1 hypothetical protein PS943_04281 [Pseudomonas fluorescens]
MASIYHYTSGSALLGIISNSEFWATDINFLNDHNEHVLGYDACIKYVETLKNDEADPFFGPWLKSLYQQLINSSRTNVIDRQTYIVSFSKISDSIAHWFSYCEKNQGYCIEFDEDLFLPAPKEGAASEFFMRFEDVNYANFDVFSASLSQVISKDSIVSRMLDAQKAASLIGLDVQDEKNPHTDNFLGDLATDIMRKLMSCLMISSCSYKNKGFVHEDERRLLLIQNDLTPKNRYQPTATKFREKNGAIYPYASAAFDRSSIKSIIVGPCSDFDFKKSGLQKLLKYHGIDCEVRQSASSLRFT